MSEKATQLLWDTWGNVYNTEKMWLLNQTDLFFVFVEQSIPSIPPHEKSSLIMSVQSIVTFIMGSADISEGKMREISWIMEKHWRRPYFKAEYSDSRRCHPFPWRDDTRIERFGLEVARE